MGIRAARPRNLPLDSGRTDPGSGRGRLLVGRQPVSLVWILCVPVGRVLGFLRVDGVVARQVDAGNVHVGHVDMGTQAFHHLGLPEFDRALHQPVNDRVGGDRAQERHDRDPQHERPSLVQEEQERLAQTNILGGQHGLEPDDVAFGQKLSHHCRRGQDERRRDPVAREGPDHAGDGSYVESPGKDYRQHRGEDRNRHQPEEDTDREAGGRRMGVPRPMDHVQLVITDCSADLCQGRELDTELHLDPKR